MTHWLNLEIASRFDEVAELLQRQGANPYRVEAYRRGAETLRDLTHPVATLLHNGGVEALERLPTIGTSLARAIQELVITAHWPLLDRLRGESDEVEVAFETVGDGPEASVRDLLSVDRLYRRQAEAGALPMIAPRRFNPDHVAWLPVLHLRRGDREYTALFSNTARAHELRKTRDWVVIYVDGGREERRYTVVTEHRGPLKGKRVVRGREAQCLALYRARSRRALTRAPSVT